MKKLIIILVLIFVSFINNAFAEDYSYPKYYGTKKCEISNEVIIKDSKKYSLNTDSSNYNYYIENGNLYKKNGELYKNGVSYLLFDLNGDVIYGIKGQSEIDIYQNDIKILSSDVLSLNIRSIYYEDSISRYVLPFYKNGETYIYSNGIIYNENEFYYHRRFYSENGKYFIDSYKNSFGYYLEKNGEIIYKSDTSYYIDKIILSNNNKNFSVILTKYENGTRNYMLNNNGEISKISNVTDVIYSPSGNDIYYISTDKDNYIFYKNEEKIGEFNGLVYDFLLFKFTDENNFYTILTNRTDYAFIKNGKTLVSYDDNLQIKLLLKKKNGDIFKVTQNKIEGKDYFYINDKLILKGDNIDERYLNGGRSTFSIYSNNLEDNQYYTYVKNNDNYDLFVNGFIIKNMYDYLELKDGLNYFDFLSKDSRRISCKDITYMFPDISFDREKLEKILFKLKKLSSIQQSSLKIKLENYIISNKLSKKNQNILQMFIDNLD